MGLEHGMASQQEDPKKVTWPDTGCRSQGARWDTGNHISVGRAALGGWSLGSGPGP